MVEERDIQETDQPGIYTIIIPVYFSDCEKYVDSFEKLRAYIGRQLGIDWKRVIKSEDSKPGMDEISMTDAFESEDNLETEKNYFYDEVFETFYNCNQKTATSCLWILKRNGKVIFDGDNTYNIDFSVIGNKVEKRKFQIGIRKLYFQIFISHVGLFVLEIANVKAQFPDMLGIERFFKQYIGNWFVENNNFKLKIPFKNRYFLIDTLNSTDIKEKNMLRYHTGLKIQNECEISQFGFRVVLYELVILQKIQLLKMSELASGISRERNKRERLKMISGLLEDYVMFKNQYEFIECTYDYKGQEDYEKLLRLLNINDEREHLELQVNLMQEYTKTDYDAKENRLLGILTYGSVCIDFVALASGILALITDPVCNNKMETICLIFWLVLSLILVIASLVIFNKIYGRKER